MSILLVVIKVVCCLSFLAAGGAKVARYKPFAEQFKEFGLPMEMMVFIGVLQLAGAVGLWIAPLTLWAFSGLTCLMAGAISQHAKAHHSLMAKAPSIALFVVCLAGVFLS
jgi:uncharacterized membrane protein YphA (DoxX/SURF4 family)